MCVYKYRLFIINAETDYSRTIQKILRGIK